MVSCLVIAAAWWWVSPIYRASRPLERPPNRTVVVIEEAEVAVLYPFRKKAIANVIDPASIELKGIEELLKATKGATQPAPDCERITGEVLERLLEIMETAKLVREPKRYHKKYSKALWGVHHTYRATLLLREYSATNNITVRKQKSNEAWAHCKMAKAELKEARDFFAKSHQENRP